MMTGGFQEEQDTEAVRQLAEWVRTESSDGAKLVSNLENNPICCVTLDESVPCLFVAWQSYATSAQLRYVHERVLELLKRTHVRKVLGDDSALMVIHIDDQAWIRDDWFPRAAAADLKVVASKRPYAFFGKQSVANVQSTAPPGVTLRSFDTLTEARCWLVNAHC
jgi:hypothetical protein